MFDGAMSDEDIDMTKYVDHLKKVLGWYKKSLPEGKRQSVADATREAMSALKEKEPTSRKAAYSAAVIIRKAYVAYDGHRRMTSDTSTHEHALDVMCGLTAETWGMRALGYGTDDYHPLLEQGKLRIPPLVRFDKRHPQPEYRKPQFPNFSKKRKNDG